MRRGVFCSLADKTASHVEVTAADTSTGDNQIADETTITRVTDPEPKYKIELLPVPKREAKTREYSHQGSLDYHDRLWGDLANCFDTLNDSSDAIRSTLYY